MVGVTARFRRKPEEPVEIPPQRRGPDAAIWVTSEEAGSYAPGVGRRKGPPEDAPAEEPAEQAWSWGPGERPDDAAPVVTSVESLWAWTPDPDTTPAPAEYDPVVARRPEPSAQPEILPEGREPHGIDLGPVEPGSPYRIVLLPGNWRRSRHPLRTPVFAAIVVVTLAVCAALPWAIPQIRDQFADAVPAAKPTAAPTTPDPTVLPPTPAPSTVSADPGLVGRKLASAGRPVEVIVPRLQVRAGVLPISGATGELLPPDNPQVLGWWMEGRGVGVPAGSAVVTGHTVSTGGGAFDHLGELIAGDEIQVKTEKGTIFYKVEQVQNLKVDELARDAEEIFSQSVAGRLVLITCSDFNGQVYLSNSVVYATPVKEEPITPESGLPE